MSDTDTWKFFKDHRGEWRWRRIASNGEIVGSAHEGFKNRVDCVANAVRAGFKASEKR